MYFVYILRSEVDSNKLYYGKTTDLKSRLKRHNSKHNASTADGAPWKVAWYGCFDNSSIATAFEKYLKTASGKAFARKRLL